LSNLRLDAQLTQTSREPGGTASLLASLFEYDIPLRTGASVWATMSGPGFSGVTAGFTDLGDGTYALDWPLKRPGAHRFVVQAEGRTSGGDPFTREKVLTASVWRGGDKPWEPVENPDDEDRRQKRGDEEREQRPEVDVDDLAEQLRRATEAGPLSTPVRRTPKRPGVSGNLFVIEGFTHPDEAGRETGPGDAGPGDAEPDDSGQADPADE
jgi:hypothetical protein